MKLFILVILVALYYVFSDLIPVYRQRNHKILWIYLTLMFAAILLNILVLINIKIPSLSVLIKTFLEAFIKFDY